MPRRQDESVAVGPGRVPGIVPEVARPQDVGHRGGAHRHARMSGVCPLNRIDRQHPDRVDAELVRIRLFIRTISDPPLTPVLFSILTTT